MVVGGAGDRYPARLGQFLQPGGDVDPVAIDVAVRLADDVAEIDADPQADPLVRGDCRFALLHAPLDTDGAVDRIHDAGELGEQAVAHALDEPAVLAGQQRLDQFGAAGEQTRERAPFIPLHQPRIAGHIRGEDRSKTTSRAWSGHAVPSGNPEGLYQEMRGAPPTHPEHTVAADGHSWSRNAVRAARNGSAASTCGQWPASGMDSIRADGNRRRRAASPSPVT
jgi:hypothetical protein